ncbi:MAG: hypothetical protein ABSB19_02855 [Methylomonas sp.]
MLQIEIDNPELELELKQVYGNNPRLTEKAFADFVSQNKIRDDINISIMQLDSGEGEFLTETMRAIRIKYE